MFRRKSNLPQQPVTQPAERITSVIADGVNLRGKLRGTGGVRIEGAYDGEIELDGLLVIGATGRVTCPQLRVQHVIIAGALRGDILAEKVEIRATGRVWGDVITVAMSTEEGAFLRGQIQMEESVDLGIKKVPEVLSIQAEGSPTASPPHGQTKQPEAPLPQKDQRAKFKRKEKGKAKG